MSFLAIPKMPGFLRGKGKVVTSDRSHNSQDHGLRRRKSAPRVPQEAFRPAPMRRTVWGQPPEQANMLFCGGIELMALKMLVCYGDASSPHHRSILWATNPITPHKKYVRLLGGLSPIRPTCRRRSQGLLWASRGRFPPAAMMVVVAAGLAGWLTSEPTLNSFANAVQTQFFLVPCAELLDIRFFLSHPCTLAVS